MATSDPNIETSFEAKARDIVYPSKDDSPFKPLDLQHNLARLLTERKRVIAVQPTGSGKTLAAALPFATNLLTPAQMIFMTPMRSLTSAQTRTLIERFRADAVARSLGLVEHEWSVKQQTGNVPDDPDFEATTTVATFDQALSSAVRLSYSASTRRRTVNAGAILGSYLVADELHLFPRGEALTTLLCLLKYRPPELPFLLMTATLTQTVARKVAEILDASVFDDPLSASDLSTLGVTERQRIVRWQDEPLNAAQITQALVDHPDRRVLVVVNTVKRAIGLAHAVESSLGGRERLAVLHSRFYQSDRSTHEDTIMASFAKQDRQLGNVRIAVATQVIEVGLDISADLIFTELAPANALVQRWGRSARWGGDAEIIIAPPSPDPNARVYPYASKEDIDVVSKTRAWLEDNAGGEGILMDAMSEHTLLDVAHHETDEKWAENLEAILTDRASDIGKAIAEGRYDLAGSLIRHVDTRTILICGDPDKRLQQPYGMEGFSLAPGSLMTLLPDKEHPNNTVEALEDDEDFISLSLPSDAPWRLRYPIWSQDIEGGEAQANTVYRWEPVTQRNHITSQPLLAINPAIVSYDDFFGLSLHAEASHVPERFWARLAMSQRSARRWQNTTRTRETYEKHISRMLALYSGHPVLGPRLKRIAHIVETWLGWPEGLLDRLTRAAIIAHDAGKLSPEWQNHIRDFQLAINKPWESWLVHTDAAVTGVPEPRWKPPHHALSGAAHSMEVGIALDAEVTTSRLPQYAGALPSNVLFTSIATHHTPNIGELLLSKDELLDEPAIFMLNQFIVRLGLPGRADMPGNRNLAARRKMVDQRTITAPRNCGETFALSLVIRMLRLADGWSQDPARLKEVNAK